MVTTAQIANHGNARFFPVQVEHVGLGYAFLPEPEGLSLA